MSNKDTTPFDTDPASDDSDEEPISEASDDEESMPKGFDDEKSRPEEESANFEGEPSEEFSSEDDEFDTSFISSESEGEYDFEDESEMDSDNEQQEMEREMEREIEMEIEMAFDPEQEMETKLDPELIRELDPEMVRELEGEVEEEPEEKPETAEEFIAKIKERDNAFYPRRRHESEITDFRPGFRGYVGEEDGPEDFIDEMPDTGFRFGDEDNENQEYEDQKKTYEGFKRWYFSKEEVQKREKSILEGFDWEFDWFDYPVDPEGWTEKDNRERWADRVGETVLPGFDPRWTDSKDAKEIRHARQQGAIPTLGPFYVPYRKCNPLVTDVHPDARKPKQIIHDLDMIEEFMKWSSCVFVDGSSYEGTVFNDLAQGKGVYISPLGLVRYEGEWFQNQMEGHGVTEVEIPDYQPVPGSQEEESMREKGKIITRDFMSPEDREWLEMDIEDSVALSGPLCEVPFYENNLWTKYFNSKPEKGRYRYAGQWKHGRMHGCGVYEVNERTIYGRFYFGEFTGDTTGCDSNISAMHAGIAEVAAAKARMFMNKPDGMVREDVGPYNDPQHPYFYEEDDAWMAPGFIHEFYDVPDYWKAYAEDVDEERKMWLNSFYKAPLRLPMPAELEHWWEKDEVQEFMLVKGEPEPDPEDPSTLIDPDPLIVHTPTGRLINYIEDEEHGVRLFWHPRKEDDEEEDNEGEDEKKEEVDGVKVKFLPLGFDEFRQKYEVEVEEGNIVLVAIKDACERAQKWIKKKKKASSKRKKLVERKRELVEAETTLRETIEDVDEDLVKLQREELKKLEEGLVEEDDIIPFEETSQSDEKVLPVEKKKVKGWMEVTESESEEEKEEESEEEKEEREKPKEEEGEEEEEEEEEEDEITPTSFGSIIDDQDSTKKDQDGKKNGRSPFASLSLPFASLVSVPSKVQLSFSRWKESKLPPKICPPSSSLSSPSSIHSCIMSPDPQMMSLCSVSFPRSVDQGLTLRAGKQAHYHQGKHITKTRMRSHTRHKASARLHRKTTGVKPESWIWPATDQGFRQKSLGGDVLEA